MDPEIAQAVNVASASCDWNVWIDNGTKLFSSSIAAVAVVFGICQFLSAKKDARSWATLNACDRHEADPILRASIENLKKMNLEQKRKYRESEAALKLLKTRNEKKEFLKDRCDELHKSENEFTLLWNYFESIALGEQQGLYRLEMIKKHLGPIILDWYEDHTAEDGLMTKKEFEEDWDQIASLIKQLQSPTQPKNQLGLP